MSQSVRAAGGQEIPHGGGSTSRLKRVALSQVGVYAAYAHVEQCLWAWVDAELYLPEA